MDLPYNLSHFSEVSDNEIIKIINNSPQNHVFLLPFITKLVNFSFVEGVFPQQFKKVVVTPLIKKASLPSDDLKNYRPLSGLCFMSKLEEWDVVKQLMQHINSNNLDNPHQSAYKTGHSTETALLPIKNEIHLLCQVGSLLHLL